MKNKYVIRYTTCFGNRVRKYFTNFKDATRFARDLDFPKSQIKRL